jgi:carboxyl-terminal processing protease
MDNPLETPARTPKSEDSVMKNYTYGVVVALAVSLSFVAGVFLGGMGQTERGAAQAEGNLLGIGSSASQEAHDVDFAQYWEVWNMIKHRSIEKDVSDLDLFYGSLAGMVGALGDPYSVYFDPEVAAEFAKELEGEFEGIGAEIGIKKNQLIVIAPLPETPAEKAGLKPGDAILAIDDEETGGMLLEEAVRRIRGEGGTVVKLLIYREGMEEPTEVPITRDTINVDSVKLEIAETDGQRIAIVTITHFNDDTEGLFREAVRQVLLEDIDGVVLDLRNNPGGYLDTAVTVAGEWAQKSVIVVESFSDGENRNYTSDGSARLAQMPTVALVNGGSASASEIVAGALQDYGKAYVIGEQTFGKGSVQDYVEFEDGSALKLTIAKWLTPNGRSIDQEGIRPDEIVELTNEDYNEDRDPQLDRAYAVLLDPSSKSPTPLTDEEHAAEAEKAE